MKKNRLVITVVSIIILVSIFVGIGVSSPKSKHSNVVERTKYVSAIGDPGMKRDSLRLAIESWNQCNEVGQEVPHMGSPRAADCFDLVKLSKENNLSRYNITRKVTARDNKLGVGNPFPGIRVEALNNVDMYASEKELYLGQKCQVNDNPNPWQFWMIMLKSGNMDTSAAMCPEKGKKVGPFPKEARFPCFGKGCMNQPTINHDNTRLQLVDNNGTQTNLRGMFYGSWDLDADLRKGIWGRNFSYYSVLWEKEVESGKSWVFHHLLRTSEKYPWLMLYLRSDATKGFSGGYHYETRGMSKIIPESPNFRVKFNLTILRGGGPNSQFYLMDMGSCWKNNGQPCDGDVTSDVTRYSEMVINPNTTSWCHPNDTKLCPPYHTFANGSRVHRNDTLNYPYGAYHMHCSPGNAHFLEPPYDLCDGFSNPQPQEILQILPHPVWGEYGYPTKQGEGWIGDPRSWDLDVGRLSHSLFFYQDPGTTPAPRKWMSIDLGTEIYMDANQVAEWTVSDFDIIVPQ